MCFRKQQQGLGWLLELSWGTANAVQTHDRTWGQSDLQKESVETYIERVPPKDFWTCKSGCIRINTKVNDLFIYNQV